jgi:hypothetical protein
MDQRELAPHLPTPSFDDGKSPRSLTVKDSGRDAAVSSFVALPLAGGASVVDPHGLRVRNIK